MTSEAGAGEMGLREWEGWGEGGRGVGEGGTKARGRRTGWGRDRGQEGMAGGVGAGWDGTGQGHGQEGQVSAREWGTGPGRQGRAGQTRVRGRAGMMLWGGAMAGMGDRTGVPRPCPGPC